MSASLIIFLVAQCTVLLCLLGLTIQGFRTKAVFALCPLLILLGPFASAAMGAPGIVAAVLVMAGFGGVLTFAGMHPRRAGVLGVIYVVCFVTGLVLMFTSPAVVAFYGQINPRLALAVKKLNPSVYEDAQKMPEIDLPGVPKKPTPAPTPREVRDLAENETPYPAAAKAPADPNAAQRAAYAKHAKDLTALYQQLNAERPKLKPGTPAMTAFNAKAAKYQQSLQALADEKTRLDALDHVANLNGDAANALASLQASAAGEDYEAFAGTLKKALAEDRQTPSFAGIVAIARTTLAQATPDKISAGLQARAARTARADFDKTTRQVQAIVNQVPPIVTKPDGAESYHYGYHPGANKPDYNTTNLIATRELWKGEYASMDDAPGVFYRSADCEFNPQTKFFYLSRSVPKKKLSDAEYAELTRLYHLLGQQEKAIADATPSPGAAERISGDLASLKAQLDGLAMK